MIFDRWGTRYALRLEDGAVCVVDMRGGRQSLLTPPDGHHVVAVALEPPFGHVTSDGSRLWVWQHDRLQPERKELAGPLDLAAAARERIPGSGPALDQLLADIAGLPVGPVRHAVFDETHEKAEPPWPTLFFGCADRVVVACLDWVENPNLRHVALSPCPPELSSPLNHEERALLTSPSDMNGFAVVRRSSTIAVGPVLAISEGFDDPTPEWTVVDCEPVTHGAVARPAAERAGSRHWWGCAGATTITLGLADRGGHLEHVAKIPRRGGETLIGVSERGEAMLRRGREIVARDTSRETVVHQAASEIVVAACGHGLGVCAGKERHERFWF